MDTRRLVIIHWYSFVFLIFCHHVYGASVYSPMTSSGSSTLDAAPSPSSLSSLSSAMLAAAASTTQTTTIETLCSHQTERYVQSDGKESSLIFDLQPNFMIYDACKRILIAPESHGFFIRLVRPKFSNSANNKKIQNQSGIGLKKNHRGIGQKLINSTYSCPLRIFNGNDLSTIWRIDPCQIELNNDIDEPVRLLPGRIKIVWEHGGNSPLSRLMITVLGKGEACFQQNKHPCLRFGYDILFCISKDLVCDGIRHCPKGNEYDSDEDYEMCSKRKKLSNGGDIDYETWENLKIEIFRNLFNSESTSVIGTMTSSSTTTSTQSSIKFDNNNSNSGGDQLKGHKLNTNNYDHDYRKNLTRTNTLASDLSKYGPWGYLMLGMLLCGGALLICGLWECCCRQNKSDETIISASTLPGSGGTNEITSTSNDAAQDIAPPNYDDLDPPPPYSVLFPNQKSISNSNNCDTGNGNNNNGSSSLTSTVSNGDEASNNCDSNRNNNNNNSDTLTNTTTTATTATTTTTVIHNNV